MTNTISDFGPIAPYLIQPLVLVGFVLMLVFSIHKQLLKAGIIPKLDKQQGGRIVELILRYGFWLGVLIVLAGFGLKFYETSSENKPGSTHTDIKIGGDVNNSTIAGRDINIYRSADYKALQRKLENAQQYVKDYPDDPRFKRELEQARQQIEDFKRDVIKLAEDLSKININTERFRLAKQQFELGNYQAARAILDTKAMSQEQDALLAKQQYLQTEQAKTTEQLKNNAAEFLFKAKLTAIDYTLPNRIEQTHELFELALKSARTPDNLFAYAYFLQQNNQFSASESLYREALNDYRQLAKDNPAVYLPSVAETLNNFGIFASADSSRRKEAESLYTKALVIRRQLAEDNPAVYLPDVAQTLNNLAILVKTDNSRQKEAESLFAEASTIHQKLGH